MPAAAAGGTEWAVGVGAEESWVTVGTAGMPRCAESPGDLGEAAVGVAAAAAAAKRRPGVRSPRPAAGGAVTRVSLAFCIAFEDRKVVWRSHAWPSHFSGWEDAVVGVHGCLFSPSIFSAFVGSEA